ncbi:FG-GAP repeat domain-containing protein [Rhodanobacter sp. Col0626]|uniref:FG-GAP repeat domain-containing protein n=1 Tax=Rhodanobacter sp. Col0626 TaxID=3415679 RepID=UPI003CF455AE
MMLRPLMRFSLALFAGHRALLKRLFTTSPRVIFSIFFMFVVSFDVPAQEIGFDTLQALQVTTPIPGSTIVPNDFNGDGLSDLLWFNTSISQGSYWLMATDATGSVTIASSRAFPIPSGYFIGATGNFNSDGLADLAITSASRDVWWLMNDGHGGFQRSRLGNYPAGWQLFGAGDVDGDGQDDLLWLNASTCQFSYWLIKNGALVWSRAFPVECGSVPLSLGYYTLSNRISIAWTDASRSLSIWDATPAGGFNINRLGTYGGDFESVFLAFGGGYAGGEMSYIKTDPSGMDGSSLERNFFIDGKQDEYAIQGAWSGGGGDEVRSGGFLIQGQGVNKTGVIYNRGNTGINGGIEVCPPVDAPSPFRTGPTVSPGTCSPAFFVPTGWFQIGADNSRVLLP